MHSMYSTFKQLEYEKEGEKRVQLREIENQISSLNGNVDGHELSAGEKVYRNDLVSKNH